MPAGIAKQAPVKVDTRGTDLLLTSPMGWPFISSTFVPVGTSVEMDITLGTAIYQAEQAVSWDLYYGDNAVVPAGQLTPKSQSASIGTGITHLSLPSTSGAHGNLAAMLHLSGLTPGATYRYELSEAIIGGGSSSAIHPNNPYQIAVSKSITANPDWASVLAVAMATNEVTIMLSERLWRVADRIIGTIVLPGMSTPKIAISPDGSKAVCTSQLGTGQQTVWVINTGVPVAGSQGDTVGLPTIASTITLAAGEIAWPVAISPDGTRAWIGFQGASGRSSTIQPINLSTGAITTPNQAAGALGAANGNPNDIVIDSTGTYAYVAMNGLTSANVVKVTLATGAVAGTANVGGVGHTPGSLALSPDNATLYVVTTQTGGNIYQITTSTMAVAKTTAIVPSTAAPTGVEVMPDGLSVFISNSDTTAPQAQIIHFVPAYDANYTSWPLATVAHGAYDMALGPYGDIWVPDYSGTSVNNWPGCQSRYQVTPSGTSDVGDSARVRITGAN